MLARETHFPPKKAKFVARKLNLNKKVFFYLL